MLTRNMTLKKERCFKFFFPFIPQFILKKSYFHYKGYHDKVLITEFQLSTSHGVVAMTMLPFYR